jgi:hypothetical protein
MEKEKNKWKMSYSIVLVLNALYILVFYLLMEMFT